MSREICAFGTIPRQCPGERLVTEIPDRVRVAFVSRPHHSRVDRAGAVSAVDRVITNRRSRPARTCYRTSLLNPLLL
jgi:hypothetical protein